MQRYLIAWSNHQLPILVRKTTTRNWDIEHCLSLNTVCRDFIIFSTFYALVSLARASYEKRAEEMKPLAGVYAQMNAYAQHISGELLM